MYSSEKKLTLHSLKKEKGVKYKNKTNKGASILGTTSNYSKIVQNTKFSSGTK